MITAFFFQNNKIEFDGEEKREKTNETSWRKLCIVLGLYFVVDNVPFGVMNQINLKLICKWKMVLYANQGGNIYTVLIVFSFLYKVFIDFTAATAIPAMINWSIPRWPIRELPRSLASGSLSAAATNL